MFSATTGFASRLPEAAPRPCRARGRNRLPGRYHARCHHHRRTLQTHGLSGGNRLAGIATGLPEAKALCGMQ